MTIDSQTAGKVYLAGAGPSDAGLLTLKALEVLKRAETVIYDALIGPAVLCLIPKDAQKIPVGKRAGHHSMKQEEISRLILEKALEGRRVVRLKGGDPFLFGRGGEELELLDAHHIPYEIIPGISSALAVPAYAGIPATYRGIASGVHVMTAHKKKDEPLDIDFKALMQAGGTYVFLMGRSAVHEIVHGFLSAGMSPEMPSALIEQGTGARQRVIHAPLAQLEEKAEKQHAGTPAVIVIGETAALGKRFGWYEKLPLFHCRIIVARPASRSRKLSGILRGMGAEVLEMPAIHTVRKDCGRELSDVLARIGDYRYLVFTSAAGVDTFFELLEQLELDIRCIGNIKLAVIGNATGDALKKRGLRPDLVPERYTGAALGKLLNRSLQDGDKVLLLRSAMGSEELVRQIRSGKQIQVTDLAVYDTVYAKASDAEILPDLKIWMENGGIDMVMFTSASTVRGFVQMVPGLDCSKVQAVCIGEMTAEQAAFYGMQVHCADKESIESMADTALKLHERKGGYSTELFEKKQMWC